MSQPLPPNLEGIVQRFEQILEPKRRYEYLLWFAKRVPELNEADRVSENKVFGCVSQVYITATLKDNGIFFHGDSDAQITKGLFGLLREGLNGLTPNEIIQLTPEFIQRTGLDISLTPSRSNGFYNIFQTMQRKALACQLINSALPNGREL
ncbi:MAG TPA: SufE family protein [Oculatellaceae cyanobacterium]|jgi:cysteine desulfuration protein SufE